MGGSHLDRHLFLLVICLPPPPLRSTSYQHFPFTFLLHLGPCCNSCSLTIPYPPMHASMVQPLLSRRGQARSKSLCFLPQCFSGPHDVTFACIPHCCIHTTSEWQWPYSVEPYTRSISFCDYFLDSRPGESQPLQDSSVHTRTSEQSVRGRDGGTAVVTCSKTAARIGCLG